MTASGKPGQRRALPTYGAVIALGFFATSLASPQKLGAIPVQSLIKNDLGLSAEAMSAFFAVTGLAWYIKPLAGVISDHVRLFGTRRRHYLLIGALVGACLWGLTAIVPRRYYTLMVIAIALNTMPVLASTVLGGLLVDVGRSQGSTGRLSALRVTAMNGASLTASLVGGFLASRALAVTCGISAGLLLTMALLVGFFLHETPESPRPKRALLDRLRSIAAPLRSRALLSTMALTFVYYAAPSPDTVIYYYRTNDLGLSNELVGLLDTIACAGGMLGALSYAWFCRRFKLRSLLFCGVALKMCGALLYLAYRSPAAAFALEGVIGFITLLSVMPFQELAARAAPANDEALGLAIVLSVGNLAISLSRVLGASLFVRWHITFFQLVVIQAVVTSFVVLFVPLLPRTLVQAREGSKEGEP